MHSTYHLERTFEQNSDPPPQCIKPWSAIEYSKICSFKIDLFVYIYNIRFSPTRKYIDYSDKIYSAYDI